MSQELWQLYDDSGQPLAGQGKTKEEIFTGLLHGSAHVWVWRQRADKIEVLVQKRADSKHTWPGLLDISAAGHIDLGEEPIEAAIRETREELGLKIKPEDLSFSSMWPAYMVAENGSIENELVWIFLLEINENLTFDLETTEVDSVTWKDLDQFAHEVMNNSERYVPHGPEYYQAVIDYLSRR